MGRHFEALGRPSAEIFPNSTLKSLKHYFIVVIVESGIVRTLARSKKRDYTARVGWDGLSTTAFPFRSERNCVPPLTRMCLGLGAVFAVRNEHSIFFSISPMFSPIPMSRHCLPSCYP